MSDSGCSGRLGSSRLPQDVPARLNWGHMFPFATGFYSTIANQTRVSLAPKLPKPPWKLGEGWKQKQKWIKQYMYFRDQTKTKTNQKIHAGGKVIFQSKLWSRNIQNAFKKTTRKPQEMKWLEMEWTWNEKNMNMNMNIKWNEKKWMNERTNEWMNEWMVEWLNERKNEWVNGKFNLMNDWMNEWMNERMNKWRTEWVNKRQYKQYTNIIDKWTIKPIYC